MPPIPIAGLISVSVTECLLEVKPLEWSVSSLAEAE